jgi:hypothetical protein
MSTKYSGGIITKTPVTPAGPYETGAAPGVWTVEQALQYTKQGIWPTAGNVPAYIEDVFSTWLYTGNGSTQTITNGINLSGQGGLVWIKQRDAAQYHSLYDTARGITNSLATNVTAAQESYGSYGVTAFNTTGFAVTDGAQAVNINTKTYASWTFREQAKFFDIVTYTGTGSATTIAHNLGSVPGCIIVKETTNANDWYVYHRSLGSGSPELYCLLLNTTNGQLGAGVWNNTAPTSTVFSVSGNNAVNGSGRTYVAYLFAHDAGGFGATGTDNVISCGSFTTDGAGDATVNLGYEPQWLLTRNTASGWNWNLLDTMRGWSNQPPANPSGDNLLFANLINQENTASAMGNPTATGFTFSEGGSSTYIYIAIRRGPMKVPTVGTSVFSPNNFTPPTSTNTITTNFPVDLAMFMDRSGIAGFGDIFVDRLRGTSSTSAAYLVSTSTGSETLASGRGMNFANNLGYSEDFSYNYIGEQTSTIFWNMRRAPSFFDEFCYTGTGVARTLTHNLSAVPEMMIVKNRTLSSNWTIYTATTGNGYAMNFDTAAPFADGGVVWNSTTPTSTVFSVGTNDRVNGISSNPVYVAYLFATCAGVSKVGSYTGTGATQTINCGFGAGGSRFVLIKRTDTTGDWYVWDSARGMVSGTDPSLRLNSTAAEVNANSIYTISTGFQIVSTAAGINASGGTYIFLSIA